MKKIRNLTSNSQVFSLLILLILVITIPLAIYLIKNNRIFRTGAAADVTLSIQPGSAEMPPNTSFKLMADSGSNEVSFVRVQINFDPDLIQLSNEIAISSALQQTITQTSISEANSTGSILLVVAQSTSQSNGPSGSFEIASLNFSTNTSSETQTQISIFDDETQIVDASANELTTESTASNLNLNQQTVTADGQIYLNTSSNTHYVGETFSVDIMINPSNQAISSISTRISYPYSQTPQELEVVSIEPSTDLIESGDWSFPVNETYTENGNILIDLSATNNTTAGYSGDAIKLATINFKANAISSNDLTFDTDETKMLTKSEPITDILDSTTGLTLDVVADNVAPDTITDLNITNITSGSITLAWSAPSDTGSANNQVASYDIRYSNSALSESNWSNASEISTEPTPSVAGTNQSLTVSGLSTSQTYFFGIKSTDADGNISNLSNIVSANTEGASLNYSFKLEGISQNGVAKTSSIDILSNSEPILSDTKTLTSQTNGVFQNTLEALAENTYSVRIKADGYLSKLFEGVNLSGPDNSKDWTNQALQAGDFNDDNTLNITDVGLILSQYIALSVPVNSSNSIYDINGDETINIIDIAIVLSNYTALEVYGQ